MMISNEVPEKTDLKVKTILISQPEPESKTSPYFDLAEKFNVKIDFRPFIHVEGISATEFRKQRVNPTDFSAVIFNSKTSVDHFFRISEELRIQMPQTTKYLCLTESIALYLQKYILYRKRKVFFGRGKIETLKSIFDKNKEEKYLYPCSDTRQNDIPNYLEKGNLKFADAIFYRTVCSDLSDLRDLKYDMIVFFSPSGIKSLFQNFPDFQQGATRIAAFGPTTKKAIEEAKLRLDVAAPVPGIPSMTKALEEYLKKVNE